MAVTFPWRHTLKVLSKNITYWTSLYQEFLHRSWAFPLSSFVLYVESFHLTVLNYPFSMSRHITHNYNRKMFFTSQVDVNLESTTTNLGAVFSRDDLSTWSSPIGLRVKNIFDIRNHYHVRQRKTVDIRFSRRIKLETLWWTRAFKVY